MNKIYERKVHKNNLMVIITDDLIEFNTDEDDYNDFIDNDIAPKEVINVSII